MRAGPMDARIGLREPVQSVDAIGTPVVSWTDRGTVWANATPIRDGERFGNSEVMASITHRFQIRSSTLSRTIDPRWRVVYDGRDYDIVAVKEIGRREGVEITASARAD